MKSELIENLLDRRCGNPVPRKWGKCLPLCEFHEKNDKEVHYQELGRADIFHIASRWLDFFLADRSLTYFYILGINFSRLNFDFFGEVKGAERYYRIYNRFFRMALQKSVKSYFSSYNNIMIDKIFHDKGDIAEYEIFPWHTIYRLGVEDDKLRFRCCELEFIDSNHHISEVLDSHLIQYIDLLLGLTYNCLHASATHDKVKELTLRISGVVHRLINAPSNVRSSYRYVNRLCVDFFPKHCIGTEHDLSSRCLRLDSFYKKRPLTIYDLHQPDLFDI